MLLLPLLLVTLLPCVDQVQGLHSNSPRHPRTHLLVFFTPVITLSRVSLCSSSILLYSSFCSIFISIMVADKFLFVSSKIAFCFILYLFSSFRVSISFFKSSNASVMVSWIEEDPEEIIGNLTQTSRNLHKLRRSQCP